MTGSKTPGSSLSFVLSPCRFLFTALSVTIQVIALEWANDYLFANSSRALPSEPCRDGTENGEINT